MKKSTVIVTAFLCAILIVLTSVPVMAADATKIRTDSASVIKNRIYNVSLEITGGDVTLYNVVFNGNLIVGKDVTSLTIDKCTFNGKVIINGADNGVKIARTKIVDEIIIDNPDAKVELNIKAGKNSSDVPKIVAKSDVLIESVKPVGEISVESKTNVIIRKTEVETITVDETATGSTITAGRQADIESIEVKANDIFINGSGTVENADIEADNVIVKTIGTKVTASPEASNVIAGDEVIGAGKSTVIEEPETVVTEAPAAVDTVYNNFISQLYKLQDQYENELASYYLDVRTLYSYGADAVELFNEVIARVADMEEECDASFNSIIADMEANNISAERINEVKNYYLTRKSNVRSSYESLIPASIFAD